MRASTSSCSIASSYTMSISSASLKGCSPASIGKRASPRRSTTSPQSAEALAAEAHRQWAAQQAGLDKLCEPDYADGVNEYMHEMEAATQPSSALIDLQPELEWHMRPYLIDFLIEIHQQFRLRPETLYLAINIVDRYVSKRVVFKKHYQLVGCAALWIAAKFEDAKDRLPTVQDLTQMCCRAYDESAFIQMEGHVLSTIGWMLGHPTAEAWLRLLCLGTRFEEIRTQHCARFLLEATLFHREFIDIPSSQVAAGALLLARFICCRPRRYADETPEAVRVASMIDSIMLTRSEALSEILIRKYSYAFFSRASSVVREWYQSGRRFFYLAPPPRFSTPTHQQQQEPTGRLASWTLPDLVAGSSPSARSDYTDDDSSMPVTPITPLPTVANLFAPAATGPAGGKENRLPPAAGALGNAKGAPVPVSALSAQQQRVALNTVDWDANRR